MQPAHGGWARCAAVLAGVVLASGCSPAASISGAESAAAGDATCGQVMAGGEATPDAGATPSGDPTAGMGTVERADRTAASPAQWRVLASGFDGPVATLVDPRTDDLLVVQLDGQIRRLDGTTVLDISDRVTSGGEQGLLDATTSPDGTRLFVHYSGEAGITTLSSFPVAPPGSDQLADPADETVLLTANQPAANHNGGSVLFGPDGSLYLALGDGGGGNDQFGNADDLDTPLGAILRLDVDTDPSTALPAPDNPYVDGGGDARIWVSGVRNPWRITHDGDQWYIADVGQSAIEEVSIIPADAGPHDLGWPACEGDECRLAPCDGAVVAPVATLTHEDGACSIIGGAVAGLPEADIGTYYFTDLCDQRVWRLDPTTGAVEQDGELPAPALALDLDVDGSVVALTRDGDILVRGR